MPNTAILTLIFANGAAEVLSGLQEPRTRAWLARAAGRGSLSALHEEGGHGSDHLDWERQLLAALGLQRRADELASAPVCRAAAANAGGFWVRAEPMHFAAGLSRMDAVMLKGAAALRDDERQQLANALGNYVRSIGLHWYDAPEWLIGFPRELTVRTQQPNCAASVDLETAMPAGADSRELRRLMTELQMVLHEHPINENRARTGLPAANAVWLWGAGSLTDMQQAHISRPLFGGAAFVRGLGSVLGSHVEAARSADQVLRDMKGAEGIVVVDLRESENAYEQWLVPLQQFLAHGPRHELHIGIDRWRIKLTRASRWRVWRRDLSLEQWSNA